MADHCYWADRGRRIDVAADMSNMPAVSLGISRLGSIRIPGPQATVLVQMRGESRIEALEGEFVLKSGDWMVLDRDSRPMVQAGVFSLCLGLCIPASELQRAGQEMDQPIYAGRGTLKMSDRPLFFRLWRRAMSSGSQAAGRFDVRALLGYFAQLQRDVQRDAQRCPGRTRAHQQQVFGRLQRARLFIEGHRNQSIRSSELANLANLSACYFSRTYTAVYGEGPQETATRVRLDYAAELLAATPESVGGIALAAGFENSCSFARAFRARFGLTATRYRELSASRDPKPRRAGRHAAGTLSFRSYASHAGMDRLSDRRVAHWQV